MVQDEDFTYTYDHAGNRTSRTDRTTGSVTTYTWDHRDRLIEVRQADAAGNPGFRVLYGYDGADRLVTRQVDASGDGVFELTERYVIEGDHILVVVDAADQVTERNLHGVRTDEVLATADPRAADPAAAVHFTLADPRGSITDTAAGPAAGAVAVLNHRVFDAYGQVITQTAPAAATRFTYTGRVADPVTALTYHRARWSDPAVGRFVSEDPIRFAGGLNNLSDYVGASPYDRTDPSGRIFNWLNDKVIQPIRNAISGAIDKVKEVVGKGLRQVADFVTERPLVSLGIAALTGGIGSILSGGVGAFLGNVAALGSKVLGSVLPKFTTASSGLGGTASLSLGKFASVSAGAGVSGTSLFAGANVSVLGVPIVGIGKSVGVLGALSDPVAGSVAGGFTDALSRGLLGRDGSIDVASFLPAVGRQGAINAGYSVLGQTGVPSLVGSFQAAAGTASDVFGAVRDVFAPPVPAVTLSNPQSGGLTPVEPSSLQPAPIASDYPFPEEWHNGVPTYRLHAVAGQTIFGTPIRPVGSGYSLRNSSPIRLVANAHPSQVNSDSDPIWNATSSVLMAPINLGKNIFIGLFDGPSRGGGIDEEGNYRVAIRGNQSPGSSLRTVRSISELNELHDNRLIGHVPFEAALSDLTSGHDALVIVGDRPDAYELWQSDQSKAAAQELSRAGVMIGLTAPLEAVALPRLLGSFGRGVDLMEDLAAPTLRVGQRLDGDGLMRLHWMDGPPAIDSPTPTGYFPGAPNRGATGFSGHRGFELRNSPLQPVRNIPEVINGRSFSGHALDQMQNRGIPLSVVEQALKKGTPFAGKRPDTQGFFDAANKIRVIINSKTGNVITVIPGKP